MRDWRAQIDREKTANRILRFTYLIIVPTSKDDPELKGV